MTPILPIVLFINHLLAQENWAKNKLLPHAGKVACIDLQAFAIRLKVSADGMVEAATAQTTANDSGDITSAKDRSHVTIRVQLSDLPLIAQNRERAFSYVKIEGDADFANTISYLSQNLRWEAEEDLSRLFGDVAAVRMVAGANSLMQAVKESHQKIQENLAEYFLEENPMLVRPAAVNAMGSEINKLRDDAERLIKRLEKLERSR
ncbi:sterol-binding protein [Undibacterium sp. Jales W-56]|uniref:ubiquinone biosynthesis accessory factor UbiJ n=1 Tax=Undibacterium sp. Jales W-56 TaxID=2897325 RepID=UPI0021CFDB42|nr:sterol-binding protein [Undibacterium sp. Jales W-56]MCU6432280.1 sterol-binding protein [Undibacterium sp. Jales W-56]